ncbi:MAG: TIGR03905 family TSCPD domain-containing protein [Clostridia bacterium]|nr:TIGR03905 family TSCPD domain-containing protein [Clostridia bacterium]
MEYTFIPKGVCSRKISFEINDGIVSNVRFAGGCAGNTQGLAALIEGMKAEDVVARLSGIRCGFKRTSCPDQMAEAIKEAIK